jgi:hypothetical protein
MLLNKNNLMTFYMKVMKNLKNYGKSYTTILILLVESIKQIYTIKCKKEVQSVIRFILS